jgi:hypothetical protein
LEVVVSCLKKTHQTYKSLLHRFCIFTNGFFVPNIQFLPSIIHQWTSYISSQQQDTNLNLKEFDNPCLLSFSKWNKVIESGKLVQKTHNVTNENVVVNNVCTKTCGLNTHFLNN